MRWQAQLDRQLSLRVSITNYLNPLFWLADIVNVNLPDIVSGVRKGVVASWSLPFDSDIMNVEVEIHV